MRGLLGVGLAVVLLAGVTGPAHAAITMGVASTSVSNSTSPATMTMSGLTAGSAIILLVAADSGLGDVKPFSISDDGGSCSWVKDLTEVAAGGIDFNAGTVFRCQSVGGSPPGTLTITIHTSGDLGRIDAKAREVINLAASPFDGSSQQSSNGTSVSTFTYTTTGAGDFVVFAMTWDGDASGMTFTPPGGAWTEDLNFAGSKPSVSMLRQLQNGLGGPTGFTGTWTASSGTVAWAAFVVGYKGAGGGGGGGGTKPCAITLLGVGC